MMKQRVPPEHIPVPPQRMRGHLRSLLADGGIRRVVVATEHTPLRVDIDVPVGITPWPFLLVPVSGVMRAWCAHDGDTEQVTLQPHDAILYGPDTWAAVDRSRVKAHLRLTMSTTDTLVGFRDIRPGPDNPARLQGGLQLSALEEPLPRKAAELIRDALGAVGEWGGDRRVHAVSLVLYDLYDMLERKSLGPQGKAYATWVAVRTYVEEHAESSTGRGDVARAVGVDARHVSRLFRTFGKTSFQAYVESMREARARRLLTETTLPVKQVASMCGYQQTSYFGKVFRRWTGMTPGRFRARGLRPRDVFSSENDMHLEL